MKYLPLYRKWLKAEKMPFEKGLCYNLEMQNMDFDHELYIESGDAAEWNHWCITPGGKFDPVRQNMLLLLAAINGEL